MAVLAYLMLRGGGGGLEVSALSVQAPRAPQGCDAEVEITGVLTTNGKPGRVTVQWTQSDKPNDPKRVEQSVEGGSKRVTVPFQWTVSGEGRHRYTATLKLIEPASPVQTASGSFIYNCR